MGEKTTSIRERISDAGTWVRWTLALVIPALIGTAALAGKAVIRAEVDAALESQDLGNAEEAKDLRKKIDRVDAKVEESAKEQKADLQRHEDKMDKKLDRIQDHIENLTRLVTRRREDH